MSFRSHPFFILALVLLIGIGFLAPGEAWTKEEGATPCKLTSPSTWAACIMEGVLYSIGRVLGVLVALLGKVLDFILDLGNPARVPAIKSAWTAVRDVANLFFGLGMVVIALATIFQLEGYGWKRALPRLIIAAILINFSFVIAATILDVSGIFTQFFLNPLKSGGISLQLASGFGLETTLLPPQTNVGNAAATAGKMLVALVFSVVMGAVVLISFAAGIVFLFVRVFVIWILLAVSPIIWIFWIFPGTQQYWHKWWETFLKWVFFAPIYVFMLWLSLYIITTGSDFTTTLAAGNPAASSHLKGVEASSISLTRSAEPSVILQFAFLAIMMFGALYVAQMGGMYGAQAGMKLAQGVPKGLSKLGLRAADRWAARGAHFPKVSTALRAVRLKGAAAKVDRLVERLQDKKDLGGKWYGKMFQGYRAARYFAPTLASPAAMKRAYAAIAARTDEVSYAGAGGRLQDAYYKIAPWERRKTAYEEREVEGLEHAMGKEIETATTEEQLAGVINDLTQKAAGGDIQARATLINALEKDTPLNGLNTAIADLPDTLKKAMQDGAKAIAQAEKDKATAAGNTDLADEIQAQIDHMDAGFVHQGYFLRSFLQHTLGDTNRAARVANDIAVLARTAGNHSFSGLTKFNKETGEFEWNDYESMKNETAGQFKKGEPQLTMRRFHPDFFMRDEHGRLSDRLSTQGMAIISQGMTFNHIREIHQMRPETSENFLNNFETIRDQFTHPVTGVEDRQKVNQMAANILSHIQKLPNYTPGKYTVDNPDDPTMIWEERPLRSGNYVAVAVKNPTTGLWA